jgi:hypothetical protein
VDDGKSAAAPHSGRWQERSQAGPGAWPLPWRSCHHPTRVVVAVALLAYVISNEAGIISSQLGVYPERNLSLR